MAKSVAILFIFIYVVLVLDVAHGQPPMYGVVGECGERDIDIIQSLVAKNGDLYTYQVGICNSCPWCTVKELHVTCGNFPSTPLIDADVFTVVSPGHCLVMGGREIHQGEWHFFIYTAPTKIPIGYKYADFCK